MSGARLLARHLRVSARRWAVLAAVVAIVSMAAMLWPRWLSAMTTLELRQDLGAATRTLIDPAAVSQSVGISVPRDQVPDDWSWEQVWADVEDSMLRHRDSLAQPLQGLLGEPQYWMLWRQLRVMDPQASSEGLRYLQPMSAPQLLDHATIVDGRVPADGPASTSATAVVEIALSVASAEELDWVVGESRPTSALSAEQVPITVTLVGTFLPDDPDSSYWQNTVELQGPQYSGTNDTGLIATVRGVISPGTGLRTIAMAVQVDSTRMWYPLATERVEASQAVTLMDQLSSGLRDVPFSTGITYDFTSETPQRIAEVIARADSATAVLAMVVAAPAGVMVVLVALASQVVIVPRSRAQAMMAQRGATPAQLSASLAAEAAIVAVPAAALGGWAAILVMPEPASPWWWLAPAALAMTPIVAVARGARGHREARTWQVVGEVAVIALAVAAMVATVRGGPGQGTADPLRLLAPVLAATAAALVCARVLPVLLVPLSARLLAGDGLITPVAAALAARRPVPVPAVTATVAGMAVAVVGVLVSATLDTDRAQTAVTSVGGDLRVTGALDDGQLAQLRELEGVATVAPVAVVNPASLQAAGSRASGTLYVAGPELTIVQQGIAGAVAVPAPGQIALSAGMPGTVGEDVTLGIGAGVAVTVESKHPQATGIASGLSWMIVDRGTLAASTRPLGTIRTFIALDDGADPGRVAADVRDIAGPVATVTSTTEQRDAMSQAPTARAMITGIRVVTAVGLLSVVLAVSLALVGSAGQRARTIAVLRTLGLPPGSAARLVVWEIGPALAIASVAGVALGLVLGEALVASTDLRPFTGSSVQPALVVPVVGVAMVVVAGVAAAAAAVVIGARVAARRSAAVILRIGEEQ